MRTHIASLAGQLTQGFIVGFLLALALMRLFALSSGAPAFRYQIF